MPENQKPSDAKYPNWAKGFNSNSTKIYHPYTKIGFFDQYRKDIEEARKTMLKYKK